MKTKILFVCLGNICRSSMAEGMFLHLLNTKFVANRDDFEVASAGTSDFHVGELPDKRMRLTAQGHGVDLPSKARHFIAADLQNYHFIVAMDKTNKSNILSLSNGNDLAKVVMMRDYDNINGGDVPDPYFGDNDGFEVVFNMLETACTNFLISLIEHKK